MNASLSSSRLIWQFELSGIAQLCRKGLIAVAVEAGRATAMAMMRNDTDALCGTYNARDPERTHVRGGTAPTSVVMGGQKLPIRRPRVRDITDDGNPLLSPLLANIALSVPDEHFTQKWEALGPD